MLINDVKRLVGTFETDIENAIDFAKNYSCRATDVIVLPIPIAPTSDIELPDTVEISKLAKYHNVHCEQAIVVCIGQGLIENGDQNGMGYCKNIFEPGSIVLMKIGRWDNVVIHKHTILRQISLGNTLAIQKEFNIFKEESDKKKLLDDIKNSISIFNKHKTPNTNDLKN